MFASVFLALLLQGSIVFAQTQYALVKDYSGSSFFNGWNFYGNYDNLTNGDAIFVSQSQNAQAKLAFVNSAGNAIIKVDNYTQVQSPQKRNTVRITTQDQYTVGSVWVGDFLHVPFGCSVWPAFWSQAPNWPKGGEIDTFEGVNLVTLNQMSLHTEPGCTQQNPTETSNLVNSTDCSNLANNNQGCVVTDPSTQSYGAGFAQAGGGVYVTAFLSTGISIWFFPRANLPSSLQGNSSSLDITTLGTPTGNWPSSGCNINNFFAPQHIIFDITLCGDFAGTASIFAQTCTGACYNNWVLGSPSNYDNAYFEIQHVRVYGSGNTVIQSSSSIQRASIPRIAEIAAGFALAVGWLLYL